MILVLLVCGAVGYYWRLQPKSDGSSTGPLLEGAPVQLAPGIYLLGDLYASAAYAVDTSEGLVLIDTSSDPQAGRLMRQLTTLGLDVQRLHTILLTHAHFDHIAGARYLSKLTGAKVYAGRGDCGVLRAGGPPEALFTTFSTTGRELHATPVDVELSGDEVITVGEARFHVLATPGHTPGSTCYLLERNGLRALFAGDMIMSLTNWSPYGGLGRYSTYLSPRYRGHAKAFLVSLRK